MNALDMALLATRVARWLLATLIFAVLSPWLVLSCFLCLASFLPHDVWSFRDTVTQAALTNSAAWSNGAGTWHLFAEICFIAVCAGRALFSPAAQKTGEWVSNRVTKWIEARLSARKQRQIGRLAVASLIGACLVLGFAANKADHALRPAMPGPPELADMPAAAALRLATGNIVSGEADVVAARESGAFTVRFKEPKARAK